MSTIKPLQHVTWEEIFVMHVYFTFSDSNRTDDLFRARIKLESWRKPELDELTDKVREIAATGDTREVVAQKFRDFSENTEMDFYKKQLFKEFAKQLAEGEGSMIRRGDALFED